MQSSFPGLSRFFFLQAEAFGHFSFFVSDHASIFSSNFNGSNFGPLSCELGELYIQNSYPMFTYNISAPSSSIFIGFCDVEFWAHMRAPPISETLCEGLYSESTQVEVSHEKRWNIKSMMPNCTCTSYYVPYHDCEIPCPVLGTSGLAETQLIRSGY